MKNKKNIMILSIISLICVFVSFAVYAVIKSDVTDGCDSDISDDEKEILMELGKLDRLKAIDTETLHIELKSAIYDESTQAGYCLFNVSSKKHGDINMTDDGVIECGINNSYKLKFAGGGMASGKVYENNETFDFYYKFAASDYRKGYEHSIILADNYRGNEEVLGSITISSNPTDYSLKVKADKDMEINITPIALSYNRSSIRNITLIDKDNNYIEILSDGAVQGTNGMVYGSERSGAIIMFGEICNTKKLEQVIVDGKRMNIK